MDDKFKIILGCVYLCLAVFLATTSSETTDGKLEETNILFKIQHPTNDVLKIARADDGSVTSIDMTTEAGDTGSSADVNSSTTSDQCDSAQGCCYQYTWPGPTQDTGTFNFSCEKYKKQKDSGPCKNPVVFTLGDPTKKSTGLRPNLTKLVEYCEEKSCKVYCAKTRSCVKYSYFQNDGDKKILFNETKFCGGVTSGNSGAGIKSGCFVEKLDGYTREVCVCRGNRCNSSPTLTITSSMSLVALIFLWGFRRLFTNHM